jgi:hypothetical protein
MSALGNTLHAIVDWIQGAVDWLQARIDTLTSVDFAFLLVAAALVYWVWCAARTSTQLGPIEIAPIVCDEGGDTPPEVEALASLLREKLAHSGFTPSIPGGVPKPDPISALAASDIPQVGWIAQLLAALRFPQAPSFTIRATLLRAPADTHAPRLRYWLDGGGTPLLATVYATTDELAVKRLAAEAFAHISQVARGAFPPWARWTSPVAVAAYFRGQERLRAGDPVAAWLAFDEADQIETTNTLPRLQLATLAELAAAEARSKGMRPDDVQLLAQALARYRAVANARPTLFEPRYRASVVAAMLVPEVKTNNYAELARRAEYGRVLTGPSELRKQLNEESRAQARKARRLLWMPYFVVTQLRLRNRYELRGDARRELRQTMRLSAQCRRLRRGREWEPRRRARATWVRVWWLWVRAPSCGWQAYYNAGCFYALLYGSSRTRSEKDVRRARRYLTEASEQAGRQLNAKWMSEGDPDLEPLRATTVDDESWNAFMERLRGTALKPSSTALQPSWTV